MRVYHEEIIEFAQNIIRDSIREVLENRSFNTIAAAVENRLMRWSEDNEYPEDDLEAVRPILSKLLDTKIEL